MRMGKRSLLLTMSGLVMISSILVSAAVAYVHGAHAAGSAIPDDGQVSVRFTAAGSLNGFRTANTIPHWSSSFTYNGVTYPFTMVGADPSTDASTTIPTVLIPLKFIFSPSSNFGGGNYSDVRDPYTIDPNTGLSTVDATLASPIFQAASYPDGVGTVQFGDAIQRATFNKTGDHGYHVLLGAPTVLPEVTIKAPANLADVHLISARIDYTWFNTQITNLLSSLRIDPHTLPIFVTYNTILYIGNPANCCIAGYHAANTPLCPISFSTCNTNGNGTQAVQTFIYAPLLSPGIGFNANPVDIFPLSHEMAEWLNDPFVDNPVPPWIGLGPFPFCQGNLETGDVLAGLRNAGFPVAINGKTFHVQSEALLPWFERQNPSTAVAGAYSYPDTTLAPTFAQDC